MSTGGNADEDQTHKSRNLRKSSNSVSEDMLIQVVIIKHVRPAILAHFVQWYFNIMSLVCEVTLKKKTSLSNKHCICCVTLLFLLIVEASPAAIRV